MSSRQPIVVAAIRGRDKWVRQRRGLVVRRPGVNSVSSRTRRTRGAGFVRLRAQARCRTILSVAPPVFGGRPRCDPTPHHAPLRQARTRSRRRNSLTPIRTASQLLTLAPSVDASCHGHARTPRRNVTTGGITARPSEDLNTTDRKLGSVPVGSFSRGRAPRRSA